MKGIILAGGAGTRLYPTTQVASKQLQAVYDKPMIYYSLSTLLDAGIRDVLLVSTSSDVPRFEALLGDGHRWGIEIAYAVQPAPNGIAEAFIIGREFIDGDAVALILGDNIFYGNTQFGRVVESFSGGAVVFGYEVKNPQRYAVVQLADDDTVLSLVEKPVDPASNLAVPGFYVFDEHVVEKAERLVPSERGELEITDLNRAYLAEGRLQVIRLGRGIAWLDSGTHESLLEASNFVATIERRQGLKIACPEEVAFRRGYVDRRGLERLAEEMPQSEYRDYLVRVLSDAAASS